MDQPTSHRPRANPDVVARRLGDGAVLVHLPTNRIFEMNDSGMRIWELVGAGLDDAGIARMLTEEFDVSPLAASAEVRRFVELFRAEGLVA